VVLVVRGDVDLDLGGLARFDIELPQAEVLLINNGLAVAGHGRPEQRAAGVLGDLHGLATLVGNFPDVIFGGEELFAAGLGHYVAVGDEIDGALGVHGPEVVGFLLIGQFLVEDFFERVLADVEDPEVGGVAAAVVFAPPGHGVAVEGKLLAVGRIAAPVAPVG